jgi:PncC family amidohydrolase
VFYSNACKRDLLGIPETLLDTCGAVSAETAAAMAENTRLLRNTDISISITGIAGPDGGTARKPVGLVWFGLASLHPTVTESQIFQGYREEIREQAVVYAINLILATHPWPLK